MPFDDEYVQEIKKGIEPAAEPAVPHYYGDVVRMLLIGAGALLLVSFIFDKELLAFNVVVGVVGVLILTVIAGLTSPKNYFAMVVNALVAAALFVVYELLAVMAYNAAGSVVDVPFALRQAIAFTSIAALYFSIKSLRGFFSRAEEE